MQKTSRQSSIFAADGKPLPTLSEIYRRNQQRFSSDPKWRSSGARGIGSEEPDPDHRSDSQPPRPDPSVRSFRYSEPAKPCERLSKVQRMNSSLRRPNCDPDRKPPTQTFDDPQSRRCTYDGPSGSYVLSQASTVPRFPPSRFSKNVTSNEVFEPCEQETRDAQLGQKNNCVPEKKADRRKQGVSFTMTGTILFDETSDEQLTPQPERARDRRNSCGTLESFLENGLDFGVAAPREFAVPGCKFVEIDEEAQVSTPENWQRLLDDRSSIGRQPSSLFVDNVNPECMDEDNGGRRWPENEDSRGRNSTQPLKLLPSLFMDNANPKLMDDDNGGRRWPSNEDSSSGNSSQPFTSPNKSFGRKFCQPRPASVASDRDSCSRPSTW